VLGDDLDSPRGRIYLMKRALEGAPVTDKTRLHLDRCLTCRACETTCPSGVRYGRLVDIGRAVVESKTHRGPLERAKRAAMAFALPNRKLFSAALALGRMARPVLPALLRAKVPPAARPAGAWPAPRHARKMLVLAGCVQPSLAPSINAAAARVLDGMGVSLIEVAEAGCCGALEHHLGRREPALAAARINVAAWAGFDGIVANASGCGTQIKDYGFMLRDDPAWAARAAEVSAKSRDVTEFVAELGLKDVAAKGLTVAYHAACSLTHTRSPSVPA